MSPRPRPSDAADAARILRAMIESIEAGQVTATASQMQRLRGALAALDAVAGEGQ